MWADVPAYFIYCSCEGINSGKGQQLEGKSVRKGNTAVASVTRSVTFLQEVTYSGEKVTIGHQWSVCACVHVFQQPDLSGLIQQLVCLGQQLRSRTA